jgi:hypothetical protein
MCGTAANNRRSFTISSLLRCTITQLARREAEQEHTLLQIPRSARLAAGTFRNVLPMSETGVRRDKAALSSGRNSHPATAPAGSNRSSHGGNEVAEAFG